MSIQFSAEIALNVDALYIKYLNFFGKYARIRTAEFFTIDHKPDPSSKFKWNEYS